MNQKTAVTFRISPLSLSSGQRGDILVPLVPVGFELFFVTVPINFVGVSAVLPCSLSFRVGSSTLLSLGLLSLRNVFTALLACNHSAVGLDTFGCSLV